MINKVAITPENLTDAQGLKHICPNQGAIYADKGYCKKQAKLPVTLVEKFRRRMYIEISHVILLCFKGAKRESW